MVCWLCLARCDHSFINIRIHHLNGSEGYCRGLLSLICCNLRQVGGSQDELPEAFPNSNYSQIQARVVLALNKSKSLRSASESVWRRSTGSEELIRKSKKLAINMNNEPASGDNDRQAQRQCVLSEDAPPR